jgi:hypothetical protein
MLCLSQNITILFVVRRMPTNVLMALHYRAFVRVAPVKYLNQLVGKRPEPGHGVSKQ